MATKKTQDKAPDMPEETRLDHDVATPSTTAPGDGPADTTDPTEEASTVGGDKAAAAEAGHLTVNAVLPVDGFHRQGWADRGEGAEAGADGGRTESYELFTADGKSVTVTRNVDTGEQTVV